jgi:hypothetical protein
LLAGGCLPVSSPVPDLLPAEFVASAVVSLVGTSGSEVGRTFL